MTDIMTLACAAHTSSEAHRAWLLAEVESLEERQAECWKYYAKTESDRAKRLLEESINQLENAMQMLDIFDSK